MAPDAPPPSDPDARLSGVDEALAAGDWKLALKLAEAAATADPESGEAQHACGLALHGLGRFEAALAAFQETVRLAPEMPDAYLDAAELLIDEIGDDVRALEVLRDAKRWVTDPDALAEIELLRGAAMAQLDDFSGALRALTEAAGHDPENAEVALETGAVLLELLRFEEAEEAFRRALELKATGPRVHQLLAFALDYTGRRAEALVHFREAGRLDPELPAEPVRLIEEEFDEALEEALLRIPERFAAHLENVEIGVQNHPDREFCRRQDCGPTTLGLYLGTPLTLREEGVTDIPDRIVLFQRSIESTCRDREELIREIAITLKHEIGHFLGMEEDELHDAGHG